MTAAIQALAARLLPLYPVLSDLPADLLHGVLAEHALHAHVPA